MRRACNRCGGTGLFSDLWCPCGGTFETRADPGDVLDLDADDELVACPHCEGTGMMPRKQAIDAADDDGGTVGGRSAVALRRDLERRYSA